MAGHQPDLFPYTGFWYKMAHTDIFDLAVHDQFQERGYQRRVNMAGAMGVSAVVAGAPWPDR